MVALETVGAGALIAARPHTAPHLHSHSLTPCSHICPVCLCSSLFAWWRASAGGQTARSQRMRRRARSCGGADCPSTALASKCRL